MDDQITLMCHGVQFDATEDGVRITICNELRVIPWAAWGQITAYIKSHEVKEEPRRKSDIIRLASAD